jgi:hypothetical protein
MHPPASEYAEEKKGTLEWGIALAAALQSLRQNPFVHLYTDDHVDCKFQLPIRFAARKFFP